MDRLGFNYSNYLNIIQQLCKYFLEGENNICDEKPRHDEKGGRGENTLKINSTGRRDGRKLCIHLSAVCSRVSQGCSLEQRNKLSKTRCEAAGGYRPKTLGLAKAWFPQKFL